MASMAAAATRPHYGGTLRVNTAAEVTSLDPADNTQNDSVMRRNISRLLFETLVTLDERGGIQPGLADSWTSSNGGQHWQITLRRGNIFSDGSAVNAEIVAACLHRANPGWRVTEQGWAVGIDLDVPAWDLPAQLSLARNSIVERDGKLVGTGAFVVRQFEPGKKLVLGARDDYRGGRPFLDAVEIELNRSPREQAIAFELGRADVVEITPEQARHAAGDGRRVTDSAPMELMALWFAREAQSKDEQQLRAALSLSIDRAQLNRVLLQNDGEPAGGLLPNWMSGYGVAFPVDPDLGQARQMRAGIAQARAWTLWYESGDPLSRLVAERIMLNARDAGLSLQTTTDVYADIRVLRIPLASLNVWVGLRELSSTLEVGLPAATDSSTEAMYAAENALLQSRRVIPLLHLRSVQAVAANVQGWSVSKDGCWDLPEVWLVSKP
jgi:peptide/nickel transport system substrate-binding protein